MDSSKIIQFLSKPKLKERGWTDSAVKKFLGDPDQTKVNPFYRSAAPMGLYSLERVEEIEASKEFKDWKEKNTKRIASAQLAVKTKTEKILSEVESWEIHISKCQREKLLAQAIKNFNDWQDVKCERSGGFLDFDYATKDSNPEFLNRIMVNFIRHQLSSYDRKLEQIFRKTGKQVAYNLLNSKIYSQIKLVYPYLIKECDQQLERKLTPYMKKPAMSNPL